jgi:hypothetical protein
MFKVYRFTKEVMSSKMIDLDPEFFELFRSRPMFNQEDLAQWARNMVARFPQYIECGAVVDCHINDLFTLTNNIDRNWVENKEVSQVNPNTFNSSTQVGDLVKNMETGNIYQVCGIGYQQLNGLEID